MKVLQAGRKQEGYSVEATCTGNGNRSGGCQAVLLVETPDMRFYPGVPGDSYGSRDAAVSFKCPECEVITDLPLSQWPPYARDILEPFNPNYYKSWGSW